MVISSALRVPGFFFGPIPIPVGNFCTREEFFTLCHLCLSQSSEAQHQNDLRTQLQNLTFQRKKTPALKPQVPQFGPAPAPSVVSSAASQGTSAPGPRSTSRCPPRPPEAAPPCRSAGGPGTGSPGPGFTVYLWYLMADLIKSIIP
jgi:hypothetical protein